MSETEGTTPEAPEAEAPGVEETTAAAPSPTPEAPKPAPPKTVNTGPTQSQFDDLQRKLEETAAKLKTANGESAERRKKLDALEREQESAQEKAIREAVEATESKNKPRVVRAEAKLALSAADALPTRIKELTAFLDLTKVEIGEDDEVSGLDDQVATLKEKYPEWFKADEPETPAKPVTPKLAVANKPAADGPRSLGERVLAARERK